MLCKDDISLTDKNIAQYFAISKVVLYLNCISITTRVVLAQGFFTAHLYVGHLFFFFQREPMCQYFAT